MFPSSTRLKTPLTPPAGPRTIPEVSVVSLRSPGLLCYVRDSLICRSSLGVKVFTWNGKSLLLSRENRLRRRHRPCTPWTSVEEGVSGDVMYGRRAKICTVLPPILYILDFSLCGSYTLRRLTRTRVGCVGPWMTHGP